MTQKEGRDPEILHAEDSGGEQSEGAPKPASAQARDGSAEEISALRAQLEEAQAKATESLDRFVRAKAETENARRRAENELAAAHKFAVERFAGELLAVRDSLDLACAVELKSDESEAVKKMREGLALTLKLMDEVFRKFSITSLEPKGEKFDPDKHHALSMVASEEVPANHVVSVIQKGYMLHDRVLRPAMVVVAKADSNNGAKTDGETPAAS